MYINVTRVDLDGPCISSNIISNIKYSKLPYYQKLLKKVSVGPINHVFIRNEWHIQYTAVRHKEK